MSYSSRPGAARPSTSEPTRPAKRARPDAGASSAPARVEKPIDPSAPPMLRVGRTTPQPVSDRQKGLRTLFTQYQKLYSGIAHLNPTLAHESALAQEGETSASTANLRAYKLAIHQAAVSISKRPPPDSLNHSSIGTVREVRAAQEAEAIAKESQITPEVLKAFCIPEEDMVKWGYPDPSDPEIQSPTPRASGKTAEGERRLCDRCKVEFVVSADAPRDCMYHHGRTAPERVDGRRMWIYSCCKAERGSAGCEEGVHVISDRDDDKKLAEVVAYMKTEDVVKDKDRDAVVDIVALDCEMVSTTAGLALARLSIVGEDGAPLLDEFVRPPAPILDYNTRFSGVTEDDIKGAVMDLAQVRAAACSFIGPDTVIVGHGLENDMRALRLIHPRVIDTAVLFPHDKGRPYRRALRDLVKEKLGYFIQAGTSVAAHDSMEDARATLELVRWKVRDDKKVP